jgi:hypothetical protein
MPFANAQQNNPNFLTYTNTDLGFTIKYPSDWKVDESKRVNDTIDFISPRDAGSFVVRISTWSLRPNETNMSGADIVKVLISHNYFGMKPIGVNTNNYSLSGHPAVFLYGIVSSIRGIDIEMMTLITTLEGKAYMVDCSTSPPKRFIDCLQTGELMIKSFQIISKQ